MNKCPKCGYTPSHKERSNPQNRYYWGIVVESLSDHTGYDREEVHEIIKRKFLTEHRIIRGKKGEVIQVEVSNKTSNLDTKQFEDLMSRIRIWASRELSVFIPEPNEQLQEA